jgi:hypothetical protein
MTYLLHDAMKRAVPQGISTSPLEPASVIPHAGSAQVVLRPGDSIATGSPATFSRERIPLSVDRVGPVVKIPASVMQGIETSLGGERRFAKNYGLSVAASTIVGGIVGLTMSSTSRSAGGGALVGYLVGIPVGAFIGSRMGGDRWRSVTTPDSDRSRALRPVGSAAVGLEAGQRIRVRAADALAVEGSFVAFEGQNMVVSTAGEGEERRVPVDGLQAVWVRKRNTRRGAVIGAITGAVFGVGAGLYVDKYVLDHSDCYGCRPNPLGIGFVFGALGAAAGAVPGALIGYLARGWSPAWP